MLMHAFLAGVVACAAFARRHQCFLWLSAAALFLFSALRYGFGNDYFSYYRCFLEIRLMGENPFPGEFLFTALNRLLPHYFVLIATVSMLFVGVLFGMIRKNVPLQWAWISAAVLLFNPYLFLMHLSAIRQSLALCCLICAIPFASKRKPLPYFWLITAACGFHNSAVILFPVYFVANPKPVTRRQTLYLAGITLLLLMLEQLTYRFLSSAIELMQLMRYQHVLTEGTQNSLRATLLSSVTFFYLLWLLPRLRGKTLLYAKLWFIGSLFSVLAFRLSMLTRLEMYFDIFSVAAFPRILASPRRDKTLPALISNVIFPALIAIILVLRICSFFTNPMWERFTVYQTIFSA